MNSNIFSDVTTKSVYLLIKEKKREKDRIIIRKNISEIAGFDLINNKYPFL